ncbi:hypothetical protein JHK85_053810 [Glycine max]|nr:hypothetical protein JHK85_053810 [Glycine max]
MGSGKIHWNIFDGVKIIAATPETLMAKINSAISNLEISRSTTLIDADEGYDARVADEAYKAGCAALPPASSMKLSNFSTSLSLSQLLTKLSDLSTSFATTPLSVESRFNFLLSEPTCHELAYLLARATTLKPLWHFLKHSPHVTTATITCLINLLDEQGLADEALLTFHRMKQFRCRPYT